MDNRSIDSKTPCRGAKGTTMKLSWFTKAFVFFLSIVGGAGYARAAPCGVGNQYKQTAVRLQVDRASYHLDDIVSMDVSLINRGSSSVYLSNWMTWGWEGGLRLRITKDGTEVSPVRRDDSMAPPPPPPPRNDNVSDFVELSTNYFWGTHRALRISNLVSKPGHYKLQVVYRGPYACSEFGRKLRSLPVLWSDGPPLFSNSVSIDVKRSRHKP